MTKNWLENYLKTSASFVLNVNVFTLLCIFHLSLFQNVTTDNRRGSQNEIACGTNFHFFFEREKTFSLHLFLISFCSFSEKPQLASGLHWKEEFLQSDVFDKISMFYVL